MDRNDEREVIDEVPGDGAEHEVEGDLLSEFKTEIMKLATDTTKDIVNRREVAQEVRFCLWDGQSDDGKKHEDNLPEGKTVFPWEGASDLRIRVADFVVNFRSLVLVNAARRAQISAKGMDALDGPLAHYAMKLLNWVVKNHFGAAWRRELMKLAQYQEGDSPGCAVMRVWWRQEESLELVTITREDFARAVIELVGAQNLDQQKLAELADVMNNPEREDEAVALMIGLIQVIDAPRAREIVRAFRDNEPAKFPRSYLRQNMPVVFAQRCFEDTWFPANTRDYQRARLHVDREWLTKAEVISRGKLYEWSEDFINGVLEHEGKTAFPEMAEEAIAENEERQASQIDYTGLYEILYVIYRATNDDGVPGIYLLTCHHQVEVAAKDAELLDYDHGQYPGVFFSREVLNSRLWDTRGCPELIGTHQWAVKFLHDSFNDYTSLNTVPTITGPSRGKVQAVLRPGGYVPERRQGEIGTVKLGDYPVANEKQQRELLRQVYEYFGIPHPDVSPEITQMILQDAVDGFLANVKDVLMQVLQLCWQFLTDDELQAILGQGVQLDRSRPIIQGKFDIDLSYDVRDMNLEYILGLAKAIKETIVPLDSQQTIKRDRLISRIFSAIDPALAADTLQPVEAATQKEIDDEENTFAKIAVGIEPPLMEEGQNFNVRLQWIMNQVQKNPESIEKMSPKSREILQNRVKHFQFMQQQEQNKIIGRVGVKPVLG